MLSLAVIHFANQMLQSPFRYPHVLGQIAL